VVILTSNRTRDVHDALKRRCLYHWVDYPSFEREVAIVRLRVPEATEPIAREVSAVVAELRRVISTSRPVSLRRSTGPSRSACWAPAISTSERWSAPRTVIKYREDAERVRASGLADLVSGP